MHMHMHMPSSRGPVVVATATSASAAPPAPPARLYTASAPSHASTLPLLAQISPLKHADFGLLSPGQSLTPHLGESPARKQGDAWPKE